MHALKHILVVGLIAFVLAACQVDVLVELDVSEDGSGTVLVEATFDEEAAGSGDVERSLRLSDLQSAGWVVEGPRSADTGGGLVVSVTKEVPSAEQWQSVLDEIAGVGVFNNFEITQSTEFAKRANAVEFDIDLADGWNLLADDDVTTVFGGEPFGVPIEELTDGRAIDDVVAVSVRTVITTDDDGQPAAAVFAPRFDDPDVVRVNVQSVTESSTAVLLRWIGYAAGALFVLATLLAITGIVLQRRSDRLRATRVEPLKNRIPGESASHGVRRAMVAPTPTAGLVRLVVIEPLTVLYQQAGSVDSYVLPFVRHNRGTARADAIMDAYHSVLVGKMTTEEFWEACGITTGANTVDPIFTKMRWLRPDAHDFLEEMQRRRIPIAAVTNDAADWSHITRERDRLREVWPWIVSSEVGTTKPDLGMFEILHRETGVAYEHCLYIDTDLANLDLARSLGMKTTLFDPGEVDLPAEINHPRIDDLAKLQ